MEILPVVTGIAGGVLLWAGMKNKHPLKAIQLALQGQDPNAAPPLVTGVLGSGLLGNQPPAGAVPSETLPGTPQADNDARTDPPGFQPGPNTYVVPILPGEAQQGSGVM